jgi:ABC-type multidrug transport system fused ATPase/permease subunit
MRRAGLVIIVIGLLLVIFTGINFFTREKVVDMGDLQISRNKRHSMAWSPLVGIAVMAVGGGLFLFGSKKS